MNIKRKILIKLNNLDCDNKKLSLPTSHEMHHSLFNNIPLVPVT